MAMDWLLSIFNNKKAYIFPSTIIECIKLQDLSETDIQIISHSINTSLKNKKMNINMINTLKDFNSKIRKYNKTGDNQAEEQEKFKNVIFTNRLNFMYR